MTRPCWASEHAGMHINIFIFKIKKNRNHNRITDNKTGKYRRKLNKIIKILVILEEVTKTE